MIGRVGRVLYWICLSGAFIAIVLAILSGFSAWTAKSHEYYRTYTHIVLECVSFALISWLAGKTLRYILTNK